ncbi:MAG: glycoside hydrolase family 3 N-terminal domain-containing protein, partial [Spirochaetales bacterium]
MEKLTLREKICRTAIMTTGDIYKRAESMGGLEAYFERYPIGGVFIGGEVIKDADKAVEQVLAVVNELNSASPRPLTFHGDFEWGVGQNVKGLPELPSIMAMAAANVEEFAYDYGAAIASDARRIGAHASYSPVADLNVNPFNQITSVRSAGDDPEKVIPLLRALVRGMQDGGVSATAKHFPGDGFDFRNQHFVTSENPLSLETWRQWSGAVFQ